MKAHFGIVTSFNSHMSTAREAAVAAAQKAAYHEDAGAISPRTNLTRVCSLQLSVAQLGSPFSSPGTQGAPTPLISAGAVLAAADGKPQAPRPRSGSSCPRVFLPPVAETATASQKSSGHAASDGALGASGSTGAVQQLSGPAAGAWQLVSEAAATAAPVAGPGSMSTSAGGAAVLRGHAARLLSMTGPIPAPVPGQEPAGFTPAAAGCNRQLLHRAPSLSHASLRWPQQPGSSGGGAAGPQAGDRTTSLSAGGAVGHGTGAAESSGQVGSHYGPRFGSGGGGIGPTGAGRSGRTVFARMMSAGNSGVTRNQRAACMLLSSAGALSPSVYHKQQHVGTLGQSVAGGGEGGSGIGLDTLFESRDGHQPAAVVAETTETAVPRPCDLMDTDEVSVLLQCTCSTVLPVVLDSSKLRLEAYADVCPPCAHVCTA